MDITYCDSELKEVNGVTIVCPLSLTCLRFLAYAKLKDKDITISVLTKAPFANKTCDMLLSIYDPKTPKIAGIKL